MIKTSAKGSTRSFAMTNIDLKQIELRTNRRYDILLELKHHHQQNMNSFSNQSKEQKKILKEQYELAENGILGECFLRLLTFFDVGISFMGDSLHNVYTGDFVRKVFKSHISSICICRSEC